MLKSATEFYGTLKSLGLYKQTIPFLNPELDVCILGAGKSGTHMALLLKKIGVSCFVSSASPIEDAYKNQLKQEQIPYEDQGHNFETIASRCGCAVVSPGIPLTAPICLLMLGAQIPLLSEIDAAFLTLKADFFESIMKQTTLITGTNGKSTTTAALAHFAKSQGLNGIPCGNFGTSIAELILSGCLFKNPPPFLALEISSYQLETTAYLSPQCAVFLNIQNDHLARYKTMLNYFKAKWRALLLLPKSGLAIVTQEILHQAIEWGLPLPQCTICIFISNPENTHSQFTLAAIKQSLLTHTDSQYLPIPTYGALSQLPLHILLRNNCRTLFVAQTYDSASETLSLDFFASEDLLSALSLGNLKDINPVLPGRHNAVNLTCAAIAAMHLGVSKDTIQQEISRHTSTFKGLAHRLEPVSFNSSLLKNVTVLNDSKATNVESVLVALRSVRGPIHLLLGGDPKGDSYLPIAAFASLNLKYVYPFGKAGPLIAEELSHVKNLLQPHSVSLRDALKKALEFAQPGDTILHSPGCASFDEFKNFEHRGEKFKEWLKELI